MIPVTPQPEPSAFDAKVRKPGQKWISKSGLNPQQPVPSGQKIPSHWTKCTNELHEAYGGICTYLCVYIELASPPSVDHFVPKSMRLDLAYEWTNYRLAFSLMNSRKKAFEDVLDPFTLDAGTFELGLSMERIRPASGLPAARTQAAQATIDRLKLNDAICRKIRLRHWTKYIQGKISSDELREQSPFVWFEADRQNLL